MDIRRMVRLLILVFFIVIGVWFSVQAAVPHLINYQGRLTNAGGTPLDGLYSVIFRLYDAESAGNMLWEETYPALSIQKGIFSVMLGSVTNLNLTFDRPYWLEIKVGADAPMTPRQQITSAGYAIRAEKAEGAEGTIRATGGLIIENRTSDPVSPATGQIWLRTDL